MKKLLACLFAVIVVAASAIALSGCSLFEKRGQLDTTDIPVIEIGNPDNLIKGKSFTSSSTTEQYDFEFTTTILVKSFRFRAYYNGTYNFSVVPACNVAIYVHSGNIVTDWWQDLPCKNNLDAGYEYTIEIKLNDNSYVNQPITLKVDTPSTETKDISNCVSFTDDYVKGEKAYYSFTAYRDGKYSFTFFNNGQGIVKFYRDGTYLSGSAWATNYKTLKKGQTLTIEVAPYSSYDQNKIKGYIKHPAATQDITEHLKDNDCVILDYKRLYKDQELNVSISADEQTEYCVSNSDVGVKKEGRDYSRIEGYISIKFKTGESYGDDYYYQKSVTASSDLPATFTVKSMDNLDDDKKCYLLVYKKGTELKYLDYDA